MDIVRSDIDVDENVANNIELLWKEEAVQTIFDQRARLKIDDSSSYFFDEVRRIAARSYIPTDKVIILFACLFVYFEHKRKHTNKTKQN